MKSFSLKILSTLAVALAVGVICPRFSVAQEVAVQAETPNTLWKEFEVCWRDKAFDQALVPLQKLLAFDKKAVSFDLWIKAQNSKGECLVRLERYAEARKAYESFIAAEVAAAPRQDWWLSIARTYEKEKNIPAAINALENVLNSQADKVETKFWLIALSMIADFKAQQGDLALALDAARDCLAIADSKQSCNSASARIKNTLQSLDKNRDRATAFMDYQNFGPFGADGVKGTADDLVNPLDSIPRAPQPVARMAAFAVAEKIFGTDTPALIQRGLMYSLQGRSKEACAVLMEACRRASGDEISTAYSTLIYVGVRGIHGHTADLRRFVSFLRLGPGGSPESGLLSDPFPSLGLPKWNARQLTATEVADLRYLIRRLEGLVLDNAWPDKGRREAASALLRLHSLLGDWGEPSVLQWYADRLEAGPDGNLQSALSHGYLAASRAGRIDWGETIKNLAAVEQLPATKKVLSKSSINLLQILQKLEESTFEAKKK